MYDIYGFITRPICLTETWKNIYELHPLQYRHARSKIWSVRHKYQKECKKIKWVNLTLNFGVYNAWSPAHAQLTLKQERVNGNHFSTRKY